MSKGIFITGTGTDIGKTYVTALIIKKLTIAGLSASYYKAAVSGNVKGAEGIICGDAEYVKTIAGLSDDASTMVSYVYEKAYSPHLASRIEDNPVEIEKVKSDFRRVCKKYEYVTVEGSGGILCPIRYDEKIIFLEDIIKELQLSALIVADASLGTINSTVLTAYYMKQKGIAIKGIIINNYHPYDVMQEDNIKMIQEMTGIPVLATVKRGATELEMEIQELISLYDVI